MVHIKKKFFFNLYCNLCYELEILRAPVVRLEQP